MMENGKDYLNLVHNKYPIRRKDEQKRLFREFISNEVSGTGYDVKVEMLDKKHYNILIGDVKRAKVVFTAHYDTPATSLFPNLMMPRNPILSMAYQIGYALLIVLVALCSAFGLAYLLKLPNEVAILIYLVLYILLFFLLTRCFVNKNNKNDNTSGVATILSLIEKNKNPEIAFILFDNEEKGLLGSKAFNKKYKDIFAQKLVLNLDCVGNGNHIIFIGKEEAIKLELYQQLQKIITSNDKYQVHFYPLKGSIGNSDYKSFKCGVGIMACKKRPLIGFYTSRIHTNRDSVAERENIEFIVMRLSEFVKQLKEV